MADLQQMLKEFQKTLGDEVGAFGGYYETAERIPTGLFPFDLATGGGFPRHRVTEIYGPEGSCLHGESFIQYEVRTTDGRRQSHKGGTLATLFARFNNLPRMGRGSYQREQTVGSTYWCPSMNDEGRIVQNRIINVIKQPMQKDCFRVVTRSGQRIVATADHKFRTPEGFVQLRDLWVGSTVLIHNKTPYTKEHAEKASRPCVYFKHHPHGCAVVREGKYHYKQLAKSRAVYEARLNGLSLEEFKRRLENGEDAGLQFLAPEQEVHHKDENFFNDAPENLEVLTSSDHAREHALERHNNLRFMAVPDVIVELTSLGPADVYDIEMASPYSNFVADGFVVHNCKTNHCMLAIKQNQLIHPEENAAVFDMEGCFDPKWARQMGVDMDRVVVFRPDFLEELHDMLVTVVEASDCGLVILDSLAQVLSKTEGEASADRQFMGNTANGIKRMVNKLVMKMKKMRQGEGYDHLPPAVIWVNQTRSKVGVIYGNPETTPGGNAKNFMYSLRLRLMGQPIVDKEVSMAIPARRLIKCQIIKNKVPITSTHSEYEMVMLPHDGFRVGQCDDWNLIESMAKQEGKDGKALLVKGKKAGTWELGGETYKTLVPIKERYYKDLDFQLSLRGALVQRATEASGFVEEDDELDNVVVDEKTGIMYDKKTGEVLEEAA